MSELPLSLKRGRLVQLVPLTMISFKIIVSFACAAFLGWLMVCALSGSI